ncbi:hypothetical protein OHR68_13585 [Spirillospora sp. NBC_00431]
MTQMIVKGKHAGQNNPIVRSSSHHPGANPRVLVQGRAARDRFGAGMAAAG